MLNLTERVAIVTGGTMGIGLAIAEHLADRGASVVVGARSPGPLRDAERALSAPRDGTLRTGNVLAVQCDVRSNSDCERLVAHTIEAFGRLDVLVNNAAIGGYTNVADMSVDHWDAVIQTNLNSLFYCSHAAIPHLRRAGDAWIINIGSLAGKNAFPGGAAYNASKFGMLGFSEALMQEVRHDGIRVTCIMPGSVATQFNTGASRGEAAWKIQPQDIAQIVLDLLDTPERTLPSRIEIRPTRPPRK